MHYVYILKSVKNDAIYVGCTNNPVRRLSEHNASANRSTKRYIPWKIVYLEGYANKDDAEDREKKIKQFGKVYSQLKRRIRRSLIS